MKETGLRIAITGPAASGKGTVSRMLAKRLGIAYVDAGWIFRYAAYCKREGLISSPGDLNGNCPHQWRYSWEGGNRLIIHEGRILGEELSCPELAIFTARLASDPKSFAELTDLVNRVASAHSSLVVDGRSAGTILCPEASFKFFITAGVEIRAARRRKDLLQTGRIMTAEEVLADIKARDQIDANRSCDPLTVPDGAITIDSGLLSGPADVVEFIIGHIGSRTARDDKRVFP